MISPLGQRQIFQTAHVEAVRQAQEVSEQVQRENVKKRVAEEQLNEDQASVRVIDNSEHIRTDERESRRGEGGAEEELPEKSAKGKKDGENPADSADKHMDFLA
jgi:hypothetical protein